MLLISTTIPWLECTLIVYARFLFLNSSAHERAATNIANQLGRTTSINARSAPLHYPCMAHALWSPPSIVPTSMSNLPIINSPQCCSQFMGSIPYLVMNTSIGIMYVTSYKCTNRQRCIESEGIDLLINAPLPIWNRRWWQRQIAKIPEKTWESKFNM